MLNFERELTQLGAGPDLIARERREVFSIHPELRALSWAGAILIATGAGVLLSKNLDRIGPTALAMAVFVAAATAYGYAIWRRGTASSSPANDYILLLGALLLSADLAYIEGKFHLLDQGWPRHLLLLTFVHAAGAYYFGSRMLLSLALAALAAWMGIEQRVETIFRSTTETAVRAMVCAAMVLLWRAADVKWRAARTFDRVFEHFAANLALAGGLILTFQDETRLIGVFLVIAFAAVVMWHGFAARAESFVLYSYAYAILAILILGADLLRSKTMSALFVIVASICAIVGLFRLHTGFKGRAP